MGAEFDKLGDGDKLLVERQVQQNLSRRMQEMGSDLSPEQVDQMRDWIASDPKALESLRKEFKRQSDINFGRDGRIK